MTFKDWATLSISLVALAVSVCTALFNVVLQIDDVRVVIGEEHPVVVATRGGEVSVEGKQELTFINSGNRTVAITSVGGIARRVNSSEMPDCKPSIEDAWLEEGQIFLDSGAFVLKAGEINVTTPTLAPKYGMWRRQNEKLVFDKRLYTAKEDDKFVICLTTSLVTPDNYVIRWRNPVLIVEFEPMLAGDELHAVPKNVLPQGQPISLLRQTSTTFRRFWN